MPTIFLRLAHQENSEFWQKNGPIEAFLPKIVLDIDTIKSPHGLRVKNAVNRNSYPSKTPV